MNVLNRKKISTDAGNLYSGIEIECMGCLGKKITYECKRLLKDKRLLILPFLLLFLCGHSLLLTDAIGAPNNCPQDITDYWNLNDTTSGLYNNAISTNDGACVGSDCPVWINGTISRGQQFDGSADSISVMANPNFDWSAVQSFTIELWIQRNTGTVTGGFEAFIGRADAPGLNWYIGINASGSAQALMLDENGSGPSSLSGSKDLRSSSADPTWHHVALVRDGAASNTLLYVDGELAASQSYTYGVGFTSTSAPLTLGSLDGGSYFDGGLDEVAIYGRDLSPDEIKSHYFMAMDYCSFYDAPIKIMPLGDSITKGNWQAGMPPESEMISYRLDLWTLLGNNLYQFDFIGSEQHGTGIDPLLDDEHAGFPGITDDQLFTLLSTGVNQVPNPDEQVSTGPYLDSYSTDIILLHIGTNDLQTDPSPVSDILDQIDDFSKNITVLLARIIDQAPHQANVTTYNNNVASMAASRIAQGDKIIMIDIESGAGFNYTTDQTSPYTSGDMWDFLHPNPSGYNKMAGKWFETLETILPQSDVPSFTSSAVTEATKGQLYTYMVTADGPPAPTYSLSGTPPAGMTIDSVSGLIQWTPTAAGSQAITVLAQNWAGQDTQPFTILINALPEAVGDAYGGILEGGTLTIPAAQGVLDNDTDENDPLSAILVNDVTFGSLTLNADGSFDYTHDGSENFSDSFTYKASDGKAESATVQVALTITPVNDPPEITGQGQLTTPQDTAIQITLANLVIVDPDNQVPADMTLLIQEGSTYSISGNNSVVPDSGVSGDITVPVQVSDGTDVSAPYNVVISVSSGGTNSGGSSGGGSGCFIESLL